MRENVLHISPSFRLSSPPSDPALYRCRVAFTLTCTILSPSLPESFLGAFSISSRVYLDFPLVSHPRCRLTVEQRPLSLFIVRLSSVFPVKCEFAAGAVFFFYRICRVVDILPFLSLSPDIPCASPLEIDCSPKFVQSFLTRCFFSLLPPHPYC